MRTSARALVLLAAAGLVACGEPPVVPAVTGMSAVTSAAHASAAGRWIIAFNGSVPANLSDRVAALGGSVTMRSDGAGLAVVSGLTDAAAASLGDLGAIGADQAYQALDPNAQVQVEAVADALSTPSSATDPTTAARYARQWNLRQIRANIAWAAGQLGSSSVKVAILDSGIDYLYPDLVGRVDLANSISFTDDSALVRADFPGRELFTDLHYHGTHVAAIVASNGIAVAGVTSRTTLMAVKVLDVDGVGYWSWILSGIVYAADHGANVINMSLGSPGLVDMKDKAWKDLINTVVDRAFKYANSKGVTIVVAAGNESQNLDDKQTFKPFCDGMHVICVSATGPTASGGTNGPWTNPDAFASYSNFGTGEIDVAGPGGTDPGPVWSACSKTSLVLTFCQTGTFIIGVTGTSQAAPHVSGLAALLIAQHNGADIKSSIFKGAVDLGASGKDAYYGNGRIDVARSLGIQ